MSEAELVYRVIGFDVIRKYCPWISEEQARTVVYPAVSFSERAEVLLAYVDALPPAHTYGSAVTHAIFEPGDPIHLMYVSNAPEQHGKRYGLKTVQELVTRYPDVSIWANDIHPAAPKLLKDAGFIPPDKVKEVRPSFTIKDAWVYLPADTR